MGGAGGERALHAMTASAGSRPAARQTAVGLVLVLVTASAAVQLLVSSSDFARLVLVWLQAVTLVAALRSAGAPATPVRVVNLVAATTALAALVVLVITGELAKGPFALVNGLLVGVAPAVIAVGLVRRLRENQSVDVSMLAGVLAIYLLAGMFFSFMYGVIDAIDPGALFAGHVDSSSADQLYFSFVTLCTVGFGDFTPAGHIARAVSVSEMLIGQIYLVTVVSLIVANLGRRR